MHFVGQFVCYTQDLKLIETLEAGFTVNIKQGFTAFHHDAMLSWSSQTNLLWVPKRREMMWMSLFLLLDLWVQLELKIK